MRDATSINGIDSPREWVQVDQGRVLAELHALRCQVATLQQLVMQRDRGWTAPIVQEGPAELDRSAGPEAPPLFAALFGGFAIYREQRQLCMGSSRPVCELGTYLIAHAGKSVTRDALMDLLWPDVDPSRAAHRLHVAVSDLRRIVDLPGLASLVRLQEDSYQIAALSVTTDCELFEQHYQRAKLRLVQHDEDGAAAEFHAALQLYTGEFLADHPYLEWATQKRVHFAERQLTALTALCEHAANGRDFGSVTEYAHAILAVDNLREQAHRHLMRAHYFLGQRAAAIRQYRACANDLERELGAAPSLLTQQLHDAICHDRALPAEIGPRD
jgi:DNA-binding SARP family transcriptional activator